MPEQEARRGLVVDWGGVLTGDMRTAMARWAAADGFPLDAFAAVVRDWSGRPDLAGEQGSPIPALERGELTTVDFEALLAESLASRTGRSLEAAGLLDRLFEHVEREDDMVALVRRARAAGLRTALLSNSWGNDYPRDGWDEMFDVVVISGEVGMRKPEPRIFEHTLLLLGLRPQECVFVDDLPLNVEAAAALGIVGVRHRTYAATLVELESLFGVALS